MPSTGTPSSNTACGARGGSPVGDGLRAAGEDDALGLPLADVVAGSRPRAGSRSRRRARARGARSAACTARRSRGSGCGRSGCRSRGLIGLAATLVIDASLISGNAVVRRFLGDLHVVHVALAHAGAGDAHELRAACASRRWWCCRCSPSRRAGRRPAGGGSRPGCPCTARGLRCLRARASRARWRCPGNSGRRSRGARAIAPSEPMPR